MSTTTTDPHDLTGVRTAGSAVGRARRRGLDDTEARVELLIARTQRLIRQHLAEAPPLTAEQKARINALLDA